MTTPLTDWHKSVAPLVEEGTGMEPVHQAAPLAVGAQARAGDINRAKHIASDLRGMLAPVEQDGALKYSKADTACALAEGCITGWIYVATVYPEKLGRTLEQAIADARKRFVQYGLGVPDVLADRRNAALVGSVA